MGVDWKKRNLEKFKKSVRKLGESHRESLD